MTRSTGYEDADINDGGAGDDEFRFFNAGSSMPDSTFAASGPGDSTSRAPACSAAT